MGILTTLLTLPVSGPVKGTMWVLEKVHEAAEAQYYDPGAIKRDLVDLERRLEAGEIDEETFEAAEEILLDRLDEAARRG
jgi:hypothetical protein